MASCVGRRPCFHEDDHVRGSVEGELLQQGGERHAYARHRDGAVSACNFWPPPRNSLLGAIGQTLHL
jgi:hypothetical protein